MGKRQLVALLILSSWCLVMVERLFLAVSGGCLQFVIVIFPDHTHLLFSSLVFFFICGQNTFIFITGFLFYGQNHIFFLLVFISGQNNIFFTTGFIYFWSKPLLLFGFFTSGRNNIFFIAV